LGSVFSRVGNETTGIIDSIIQTNPAIMGGFMITNNDVNVSINSIRHINDVPKIFGTFEFHTNNTLNQTLPLNYTFMFTDPSDNSVVTIAIPAFFPVGACIPLTTTTTMTTTLTTTVEPTTTITGSFESTTDISMTTPVPTTTPMPKIGACCINGGTCNDQGK
jgi:hypothetical protein